MSVVTVGAAMVLLILMCAPETAIGRWLHRHVVVPIAARVRRRTVAAVLLLAVVFAVLGCEGAQIVAMGVPDAVAFVATIDLGLFVDVIAASVAGVAMLPVRRVTKAIRPARRRGVRHRPVRLPVNDEEARWRAAA